MSKFWNSELSIGYYDKIVEQGFLNKKGIRSYWHISTLKKVLQYINNDLTHLDYACGPGTLIGLTSNDNSIGIDISYNQIEYANNKYSDNGKFYTLEEIDFNKLSNQFDIVTILGLVEFLNDNEISELMITIDKILKINGKIILTTPNFKGNMLLLEKVQNYFGSINYSNQHINKFDKEKLTSVFNSFTNYEFNFISFLNISIIFSSFSHNFALRIEKIIANIFKNKFGSLFLVVLTKKS